MTTFFEIAVYKSNNFNTIMLSIWFESGIILLLQENLVGKKDSTQFNGESHTILTFFFVKTHITQNSVLTRKCIYFIFRYSLKLLIPT